ncbi:hypothetical protein LJC05_01030 [Bacteroides sp. OttesenSCG-928-J23]|nr:hypothetical protein [Bacteroides sp. OttesenSCG-928-J23]MDL2304859.1 hypothetical protein [Bacteroides sp. OttesenSCG-928-D19]
MKNIANLLLFTALILFLFTSCTPKAQLGLFAKAQNLMDTHPDSALYVLEHQINKQKLTTGDHALWCLLTTKAKDKCYITHDSDSIINIALAHYKKSDDKDLLMEAYYYMGRVHHDMNNILPAQDYYLQALAAGEGSQNYAILSRLCYNISFLYLYQDVYEQALVYQKKALHFASINNDSAISSYTLRDIGRSFSGLNRLDSSLYYYGEALKYADDSHRINIYNELGIIYRLKQDYEMAYQYLLKVLELIPENKRGYDIGIKSNLGAIYLGMNKLDSAMVYLKKVVAQNKRPASKANANYYLYKLFKQTGDKETALIHLENAKILFDSLNGEKRTRDLRRMEQLYNHHQALTEIDKLAVAHAQSESSKYKAWLICVAVLIVASFVFMYLRKRFREKRMELEKLNKQQEDVYTAIIKRNNLRMEVLKKTIRDSKEEVDRIKTDNERLKELQEKREASIEGLKLSDIYIRYHQAAYNAKNKVTFRITPADKEELINSIEKSYPAFADRIRLKCPGVSNDELYLCYLHKIGITSPLVLAEFLCLSANSITSKRDRLYEKLFQKRGNRALFERYIDSL